MANFVFFVFQVTFVVSTQAFSYGIRMPIITKSCDVQNQFIRVCSTIRTCTVESDRRRISSATFAQYPDTRERNSLRIHRRMNSLSMNSANLPEVNDLSSTSVPSKVGPSTLTKDTLWKLSLSLTGVPQDGSFGPGL